MSRKYAVKIGDGVAVLTTGHSSTAMVAKVLGDETSPEGMRSVWLDRRVHLEDDTARDGWRLGGALTTVLTRKEPHQEIATKSPQCAVSL